MTLEEALDATRKRMVIQALQEHGGHITHAAAALDVDRGTVHRLMREHRLTVARSVIRTATVSEKDVA